MSPLDILILAGLAVAVGLALRAIRRGKGRCGGDCSACKRCVHPEKREEKEE